MKALHVNATHKLVKAASGRIGHWVQLSSVGVYGAVRVGCVTEDSAVCPEGHYETTKAESDQIVMNGAESGGFSCSILRPSNVFGADMTNQSLFGLIRMIDRGLFFYVGELGASANYIHVNNVIEGLIRCGTMDAARGRIFNLSDFRTIEQFTESVAYALGRSAPRLRIPSAVAHLIGQTVGRVPRFPLTASRVAALENRVQYSIEHIQQVLQYSPIISMEQGIDELVAAYQQKNAH
jgi:nucleoside-diphosphate-sugar epimerase